MDYYYSDPVVVWKLTFCEQCMNLLLWKRTKGLCGFMLGQSLGPFHAVLAMHSMA